MDGLIIVDKPAGWSSHDVVLYLRNLLKIRKIGHAGTLDPLATGVLLITLGQATKLFPFLSRMNKTYLGEIKFGMVTDTYDSGGKQQGQESFDYPEEEELRETVKSFEGQIWQLPPPFSAKKINGQPAFKLARKGLMPPLKPVKITIHRFLVLNYSPPHLKFEVECSSGTYVRTLAHDLGQKVGCGAHLVQLRRLAVGWYTEEEALSIERIKDLVQKKQFFRIIRPLEYLLPEFPAIWLDKTGSKAFLHGSKIALNQVVRANLKSSSPFSPFEKQFFRIFSQEGYLLGLAIFEEENKFFQPKLVLKPVLRTETG